LENNPHYTVGFSLLHLRCLFRSCKMTTWSAISVHKYHSGGTTTVRVLLTIQRWLLMPLLSPPWRYPVGQQIHPHASKPGTSNHFISG
jgi:hypothetical protein